MEGLTACTEYDVTANGHIDVTTMGLSHTHRTVSAILHLTTCREEVGGTVGRTHHGWMNGRDMYTCILLGGNERDDQTMTEDITHVVLTRYY